jgi:phosphate transport system protein
MAVPQARRLEFTAALGQVRAGLAEFAGEAGRVVVSATEAVAGDTAGQFDTASVHAAVGRLRGRVEELDRDLVALLALQTPVAGDLRLVVAGLRISGATERMAELADHIAAAADRRAPAPVVPEPLRPTVERLGGLCADVAARLATAITSGDPATVAEVENADDQIDGIHRHLLAALTDPGWPHGVQAAVDLTLLSRYYERFADQAVGAARHLTRAYR